jgi:PAS domain S-box-containing protein
MDARPLYRLTDLIADGAEPAEIHEAAVDAVMAAAGADRASILAFDESGVMRFTAWRRLSDRYRAAVEGHSPWVRDTKDASQILVPDTTADRSLGALRDVVLSEGIRALAFIPLVHQHRLLGKFMVYYDQPHQFSDEELEVVRTVAHHVAFGLDRARAQATIEDLLERERAARHDAERLRGEEAPAYLAAIVDSSHDAIVAKTVDGVITAWNPGAERMFGWTAAEAVGRHVTLIIPEERRAEEDDVLARILRGERVDHFETVRVAKDGRRLDVSLTVSPVRDAAGRIIGASKVARDVTGRRHAEEERMRLLASERRARAQAEALNRTKDEFLATVSHELRTPLNAIFGWARMLQSSALDDDARARAVDAIVRSASAQAHLVEDLLDLSRIVTGRMRLDLEPLDLRTVIDAALEGVRPAAHAKNVALTATLDDGVGPLLGASDRLQQVIWNLVMNAVKFTPHGGRVQVSLRRVEGSAEIVVADTGEGISADVLPHVFERFRQEDSSTTRAHAGLGLGLALVRHLVELHGGHVRAESPGKGQGATFTVTLPLMPPR